MKGTKLASERLAEIEKELRNAEAELASIPIKVNSIIGDLKHIDWILKNHDVGRIYSVNKQRIAEAIETLERTKNLVESIRKSVIFWTEKHAKEIMTLYTQDEKT